MIGATRVWVVGEILTAANMNTFLSTLIEDLAGRNGAVLFEDAIEVVGGAGSYFRAPSLTTVQRDALTPQDGYQVYNNTDNQMQFRENGAWVAIGSHAATHAGGGADDIGGEAMIWTVDQVWNDNVGIVLGTNDPGRTRIFHDGTDLFFDNFVGASTSSWMIALADGFPSPDGTTVHIWRGTAGAVTANARSVLVVENNDTTASFISILGPNIAEKGVLFGEPSNAARGAITYFGSTGSPADTMNITTAGVSRLRYSAGAFAFQEGTIMSTTAGNLTLNPAGNTDIQSRVVLTAGFSVSTTDYVIQRDTGPTNDLIINVPINAQISLRINGVDNFLLDPTGITLDGPAIIATTAGLLDLAPFNGRLRVQKSIVGNPISLELDNTSNTAGADAFMRIKVAGTTADSPYIHHQIIGRTNTDFSYGYNNGANELAEWHADNDIEGANDIMRLKLSNGILDVLGDSGLTAATVGNFDDLDDPIVLQKWCHGSAGVTHEEDWLQTREFLFSRGILSPSDHAAGPDRYFIALQPMLRLQAGGIYQNRAAIDQLRDEQTIIKDDQAIIFERVDRLERVMLPEGK